MRFQSCIDNFIGFCAVICTYVIILYAIYSSVFIFLLSPLPISYGIPAFTIFILTTFVALICHIKCMISDPGSYKPVSIAIEKPICEMKGVKICSICGARKEIGTRHCRICKKCIR
uniref:Palmitoyltransferase ZDHHC3 (Trinotate prediction) n=1 Tax=Myxobolus squamalis TaxID=59785 RepID=A0A6B2G5F4_MYXSQ